MIKRLLIANRGEIACRILRTAKHMGIETISVFSEPDHQAQHVLLADKAIALNGTTAQETYLDMAKILDIARTQKVDAIHPGYGFLSENSRFAHLCEEAGLIFIGPSAHCIQLMGDKAQAKKLMKAAKIPTIPGYESEDQSEKILKQAADHLGYPLLIKAAGGGGGKGMRLVHQSSDFLTELHSAKMEAQASFHNDCVLLEKYLPKARHVEIQIFADQQGNVVHLFSRDCSIQRRHQKIIEEAPAPNLPETLLAKMGETAIQAARTIQYTGAGTIEFMVDAEQNFYFMEMNTRLQVEHPVTEMITGQDLVAWQIKIAEGEALPCKQNALSMRGHAIEVRLCAENPLKNFMPATGTLDLFHLPQDSSIRIDSGVVAGDSISPYYDSLLAKLIVHGNTRREALEHLQRALKHAYIAGVETNLSYLSAITHLEAFEKAKLDTQFIAEQGDALHPPKTLPTPVLLLAALAEQLDQQTCTQTLQQDSEEPASPWFIRDNWRLFHANETQLHYWFHDHCYTFNSKENQQTLRLVHYEKPEIIAEIDGETVQAGLLQQKTQITLFYKGQEYMLRLTPPIAVKHQSREQQKTVFAPMPSTVIDILVTEGQAVTPGEQLMVLEAMKMQNTLLAKTAGTVKNIYPKIGDLLTEGSVLIEFL